MDVVTSKGECEIIRGCHNRDKGTAENERLRNPKFIFSYPKNERLIFLGGRNPEYKIIEAHNGALGVYALHAAKVSKIPVRIFHAHGASITKDWKLPIKLVCKACVELAKTDVEAARKLAEKRKYQSEATVRSYQKMKADAEAGDPEAIARYEAHLAKRREEYHRKKGT